MRRDDTTKAPVPARRKLRAAPFPPVDLTTLPSPGSMGEEVRVETLFDLMILFGLAIAAVLLFRRLRFPAIVGFLFTGLLAGPYAFALIREAEQVEQLAGIGVVLLLFTIGIEFSMAEFGRVRNLVLWGGGLQVLLAIAGTATGLLLFGFALSQAVFIGFLVSLSSTAIVMKLLLDAGEMDTPHGKAAMGI